MKKLPKREIYEVLQAEYIQGTATLQDIANRYGCTRAAVALAGSILFPDWKSHTSNRPYRVVKLNALQT